MRKPEIYTIGRSKFTACCEITFVTQRLFLYYYLATHARTSSWVCFKRPKEEEEEEEMPETIRSVTFSLASAAAAGLRGWPNFLTQSKCKNVIVVVDISVIELQRKKQRISLKGR